MAGLPSRCGDPQSPNSERDPAALRVEIPGDAEIELCFAIRRTVFVAGQGVSEREEIDGLDPACTHFLARAAGDAVGTARLRFVDGKAKAERVAVLDEHRRRGVGAALMLALEQEAARLGSGSVVLHAQEASIPFYEILGYRAEGERFFEADIPHRRMSKSHRPLDAASVGA